MDWIKLCEDHTIDFVTRSPNTKRGEISIRCPMCGDDDPSMHMGISLTAENWGCHRTPAHRGHSAVRLIAALLGCSTNHAKLIQGQYSASDPSTLDEALAALTGTSEAPRPTEGAPEQPPDFRPIQPTGSTAKFWRYLQRRGFYDPAPLIDQYHLQCALTGRFSERLLIPFYRKGVLVAWTGRAIGHTINAPRYLSSKASKETVFNEDKLAYGGELLFVVEGPFDALKLDYYGQELGARATCGFGVSLSMDQLSIISSKCSRFDKVVVLFDQGALEPMLNAVDWLRGRNVSIGTLPDGVKDPGEMTKDEIVQYVKFQLMH